MVKFKLRIPIDRASPTDENKLLLQKGFFMQVREIITSYKNGKSAHDIAESNGLSTTTILHILRDNNIDIRSHSEASYLKSNPNGDPFDILKKLTPEEEHLKAMALGLYITEGNMKNKNSVKFSNSNPAIIKIFVKFLKVICGVPKEKIKASLIVYPDVGVRKTKEYWVKFLDLPEKQFSKTTILKRKNNGGKKHSQFGTATVYVHNSKLLKIIKDWVKEYAHVAQLVEHVH